MNDIGKLDYSKFITLLSEFIFSYHTTIYANAFLFDSLLHGEMKNMIDSKDYILAVDEDKLNEGFLQMNGNDIIKMIEEFAKARNSTYKEGCKDLLKMNTHFLRGRILNAFYEITMNYIEGFDSVKQKALKDKLFKEDWFKVLYVLRNTASHFDNYGKEIEWIFKKKDQVSWHNIIINKNDIGHLIRYNDAEIYQLVSFGLKYFLENQASFE